METPVISNTVLGYLRAVDGITVHDGVIPTTPGGGYVVFYDQPPALSSTRLSGQQSRVGWSAMLVCAGRDANEVRWVVAHVISALADRRVGSDRGTGRLRFSPDASPILRSDRVAGDVRLSQTLTVYLHTTRSPA